MAEDSPEKEQDNNSKEAENSSAEDQAEQKKSSESTSPSEQSEQADQGGREPDEEMSESSEEPQDAQDKQKTRTVIAWVVVILFILTGVAYWWFFLREQPQQSPLEQVQTHVMDFRAKNIPQAGFGVSDGNLSINADLLSIPPTSNLKYVLWSDAESDPELVREFTGGRAGIFDLEGNQLGTGAGIPIGAGEFSNGETTSISIERRESSPNSPSNRLISGTFENGNASLRFPVNLSDAFARFEIASKLNSKTITINLQNLDDLSPYGLRYRAWLTEMDGDTLLASKPLGAFQGSDDSPTRYEFNVRSSISRYNTAIVTIEPQFDLEDERLFFPFLVTSELSG